VWTHSVAHPATGYQPHGPTPHNLSVRDANGTVLMATDDLSPTESETISAELEPGEYVIFCSLAGHESLGMSGTLVVTAP
jgi:plastocyanin